MASRFQDHLGRPQDGLGRKGIGHLAGHPFAARPRPQGVDEQVKETPAPYPQAAHRQQEILKGNTSN